MLKGIPNEYVGPLLGTIKPKHARDINASNWSVGTELLDRDYTLYKYWREYLGPLGVKGARTQSGWAKTEKQEGVYNWEWLDEIIPDMVEQGVKPWINLVYGNPIYGDAMTELSTSPFPMSTKAREAWKRYVKAFIERYGEYVTEWEVWNEPDHPKRTRPATDYAGFLIDTAKAVREVQPEASIFAIAGTYMTLRTDYALQVLDILKEQQCLDLVNEITYHAYWVNPDEIYPLVMELQEKAAAYAPHITLRQGECGMPSGKETKEWDSGVSKWSYEYQAKWSLRRMLGDLGRGIPSSYFTIADFSYPPNCGYGAKPRHTSGLLATDEEKRVTYVKPLYYSIQYLTAIFDDCLHRIDTVQHTIEGAEDCAVFHYRHKESNGDIVTIWQTSQEPVDGNANLKPIWFGVEKKSFTEPVIVDLLNGKVYGVIDKQERGAQQFVRIPVWDTPVVIAERSLLSLK